MPEPLLVVLLWVIGVALIALGVYVFRLYRATFSSDPQGTITRDLLAVLSLGSWAAPPLLAGLVCYVGGLLCVVGFLIGWFWLTS